MGVGLDEYQAPRQGALSQVPAEARMMVDMCMRIGVDPGRGSRSRMIGVVFPRMIEFT